MDRVRILAFSALACILIASATTAAADRNPLIGRWTFSGDGYIDENGHNWCNVITEIDFGQKSKTVVTAAQTDATGSSPGARTTTPAYYAIYGTKIYVSETDGLLEGPYFTVTDHNHMQDDTIGHCVYQRE